MSPKAKDEAAPIELIASNKAATHNYFITDKFEAGLVLKGTEVKSLRAKHCQIKDSYARVDGRGNLEILNFHINPYEQGNRYNPDPDRSRRLLVHKREITKLENAIRLKGLTIVPLRVYFKGSYAKMELGLGKGKQEFDKRATVKERDLNREARQALKGRQRD
jgi:SsrA-binding protein